MTKGLEGGILSREVIELREYLGEEKIAGNDGSQAATLPIGTAGVWIMAEDGVAYAAVNAAATVNSGMYVPQDTVRYIGPYTNIDSLAVWAATGVTVHLIYEQ